MASRSSAESLRLIHSNILFADSPDFLPRSEFVAIIILDTGDSIANGRQSFNFISVVNGPFENLVSGQ